MIILDFDKLQDNSFVMKVLAFKGLVFVFVFVLLLLSSCVPVKEYQKAYLNDEEMQLGERKVSVFEADFHSYREGAVGGTIGNSGSGCGCN